MELNELDFAGMSLYSEMKPGLICLAFLYEEALPSLKTVTKCLQLRYRGKIKIDRKEEEETS